MGDIACEGSPPLAPEGGDGCRDELAVGLGEVGGCGDDAGEEERGVGGVVLGVLWAFQDG